MDGWIDRQIDKTFTAQLAEHNYKTRIWNCENTKS